MNIMMSNFKLMKEQQKQYLIDMMKADEELGLYNESLDKKSYLLGYTDSTKKQDDFAIGFAKWLRENDTPKNAEKYFGYSDLDMLQEFKKEKGL